MSRKTFNPALFIGAIAFLFLLSSAALAATVTVTNTADSGAGSLRSALTTASSNDTITFNIPSNSAGCVNNDCTITLTSGELSFPSGKNLTMDGGIVNVITLKAGANSRVMNMINNGSRNVTLNRLVITSGAPTNGNGGGIWFQSGGALTISNSTISNNTVSAATGSGAGIYMANASGTLSITSSTISGNKITGPTGQGAGIWIGVAATIINCTVSGNTITGINGNGGGIYLSGSSSPSSFDHLTITDNSTAGVGGGVYAQSFPVVTVRNTAIAGNSASGFGPDVAQTFTSDGYNVIGKNDFSTGWVNGTNQDQVGTIASPIDPKLSVLTDLGGPTKTHTPLLGSPLIDHGKAFASTAATVDQRGYLRPVIISTVTAPPGGNGSDVGAFELQAPLAGEVSVSGRVTTANGMGIAKTTVMLIGGNAESKQALTNPFGYYTFDGLDAGSTYVISASSKQYVFVNPVRIFTANDAISGLDFTAVDQSVESKQSDDRAIIQSTLKRMP